MVTHDQPDYLRLSLPRLLETCDERMRVWLWHNGTHEETLELSRSFADDPRVARFHHSVENVPASSATAPSGPARPSPSTSWACR